jgi:hypothetical protein
MDKRKNVPINYYARDYQSIKQSLVEHAKRYYPEVYKDFNEASFGSLMFDTVSYIGDVLSFYLDYQANESFIDTATEFKNIIKLAKQIGYKHNDIPTSYGVASFFITVPATANGLQPDTTYIPVLKKDSEFVSDNGISFLLLDDVKFDQSDNEIVVAANDPNTNIPTYWAIKSYGAVMSGKYETVEVEVGEFERFLKVKIPVNNVAEIMSVKDEEGNEYYEVENLSQDVIYVPIANRTETSNEANSFLRPYSAPRRFVVEKDAYATYIQFGYGTDSSDSNREKMVDPAEVVLKKHAKNYISDASFDPSRLVQSDKLGIVPVNTKLQITVRTNETNEVNIGIDKLTTVSDAIFEFSDPKNLDRGLTNFVKSSLELTNEEKIVGQVPTINGEEIKLRALNSFSAQNRAVTLQDYKTLVYNMPNTYGKIKRVNVVRDKNSLKRNLNLYVISEDENRVLTETNSVVKENIKVWLNNNRMINDTVDILDAKILNLGINYTIVADIRYNKQEILNKCNNKLKEFYSYTREIGEPFFVSDINSVIKEVKGVLDIGNVVVVNKNGGVYSDLSYNLDENRSADGRYIEMPSNVIYEIKYPNDDIKGAII